MGKAPIVHKHLSESSEVLAKPRRAAIRQITKAAYEALRIMDEGGTATCGTAEEDTIDFIFVCQSLNQVRNVYIYPHVGVVTEPTIRNVTEMLLPENCECSQIHYRS